ncbi:MAG: hypothetical protein KDC73_00265 [Ignavibacteriae bacterium]|nr:hypothetical protein [Ignavibacteriota bacterium]MCB9242951.1 hypothetical protein [Ignavibacteriales bacterium]
MRSLLLFICALFVLSFGTLSPGNVSGATPGSTSSVTDITDGNGVIYEYVTIDGITYVYVYKDGVLVEIYEMEE